MLQEENNQQKYLIKAMDDLKFKASVIYLKNGLLSLSPTLLRLKYDLSFTENF